MRLCFHCGADFETWGQLKEHLAKAHNNKKYCHQFERTVAFGIDSSGRITRFQKPKRE